MKRTTTKNSRIRRARVAVVSAATLIMLVTVSGPAQAIALSVPLGTANSFVVLAGTGGITNTGPTTLNGDIGNFPDPSSPAPGYGGALTINGVDHQGDGVTQSAKTDLTAAYLNAAAQVDDFAIVADLGGQTLTPGVYDADATMNLSGPVALTLDANGDPNAVWVFQADADLIVGSGASVSLVDGAQACNVFWQVTSSASIGTDADFVGTILALTSITIDTNATILGRALARNGTVTMDSNTITRAACASAPTGGVETGDGSSQTAGGIDARVLPATLLLAGVGVTTVMVIRRRRHEGA